MKKLLSFFCMALAVASLAQAQITTGENTSQVIRTGNRAEKGDYGLYLGATTTMFKNLTSGSSFSALPLINLKYMVGNKTEARLGIEWWKKSDSSKFSGEDEDYKSSEFESNFMFYPGIAYHFNRSNILDVYVGAELPIGGGNKGVSMKGEGIDKDDERQSTSTFQVGLGAFIGLQAYIANLPLAVGIEYGISANNVHSSNGTLTAEGMTVENYAKDCSNNRFRLGNQARITLTYFFKP